MVSSDWSFATAPCSFLGTANSSQSASPVWWKKYTTATPMHIMMAAGIQVASRTVPVHWRQSHDAS
eukprot:CAMPEP_0181243162 /NCGR_PEP_ID=MMETSP1096-20121128/42108_1 /TAXON_ID=156174 ORGANISM="Chrysochromulina ericina, Strain CCMP281" /NCGR_SAMPLE_ID=MMETSP1096 /ASSEMBLY_ACC=CAM_ASM_000453 /LENGTH=65 /DNA_ID=CAMNT_0023339483 /DNA_START=32 /DNA_END=226 /DNA_ORIENTATION=-